MSVKNLLLIPAVLLYINTDAQWTGATIDSLTHNSDRDEVHHQCMDIDQSNMIHLIYSRDVVGQGNQILYRRRDVNSNWLPEVPITGINAFDPVIVSSITPGEAWVAYDAIDTADKEINYCSNAGGNWNCTQLTNNAIDDFTPTIDVDSSGHLHIAWVSEVTSGNFKINYATDINGTMVSQTIALSQLGQFGSGAYPEIAVEKNGIAHIIYRGNNGNGYRIHHVFNDVPGGSNWTLDYITTPNDEDLSCSIQVDDNGTTHVLVSGDDCFGCPTRTYYQKKLITDTAFQGAIDVAPGFGVSVGDLYVDYAGIVHAVMNEISGNIYTGNVIYANSDDWNGYMLLNTADTYEANLVVDNEGHAMLVAYRGNTFLEEEIIVFGTPNTVGIHNINNNNTLCKLLRDNNQLKIYFSENFSGRITISSVDGKIIYDQSGNFQKDDAIHLKDFSSGMYVMALENSKYSFRNKFVVE
jgi:hypothetical protein